jgi:predicted Zn-dependent protease
MGIKGMPDLKLRSQLSYAREQLDGGMAEQAVQVCRRILETFPRCVEAYVVFGEALLALDKPARANDLLRRAWGACPENATISQGLASVAERQGHAALAHAWRERAAETQGVALAIDGPDPVPLTRPALCHAWLWQGQYDRAARELGALVAENPSRYDLRVALAEALWRSGNQDEAARLAQETLATQPYCLVALLLAGSYWLHSERDEQARDWLALAQELDPENARAQSLLGDASPLPPRSARLPFRETDAPPLDLPYDDEEDLADDDWPEGGAFPSLGGYNTV